MTIDPKTFLDHNVIQGTDGHIAPFNPSPELAETNTEYSDIAGLASLEFRQFCRTMILDHPGSLQLSLPGVLSHSGPLLMRTCFHPKGVFVMKKRPRLFVGVGVLCFVGVMALWLASSGDKAIADKDNAPIISQSLTQSMNTAMDINGVTKSKVTFKGSEGVVQKVSVYVNVKSADARSLKVWLTSPSGTKVQLVDGAKSDAVKKNGLEGMFGADGLSTIQSLDAFAGEPATGDWQLSLDSEQGKLVKWSVTTDLSPNAKMAGMETYGEYDGSDGGCDCRVAGGNAAQGLMASLFLLGLVLIRRRS